MFIYETGGLPDVSTLGGWYSQHDKRNWGIIPYAVPALDNGFVTAAIVAALEAGSN